MSAREIKKNAAAAAKEILAQRLAPVESLATSAAQLESAREAVQTAESDYATKYQAARDAGWSTKELADIGLTAPTSRKRRTPTPTTTGTATPASS